MPRPLKPLNPYESWPSLFGATVRQLRLRMGAELSRSTLTQAEFGQRLGYDGSTISAIERATIRPDERFVSLCERAIPDGGVLRSLLPFVTDTWAQWEQAGGRPGAPNTGAAPAELLTTKQAADPAGAAAAVGELADSVTESLELVQRIEATDVGAGALDNLQRTVDRYCRDYPTELPGLLIPKVQRRLRQVRQLLDARLTLAQHREVLVAGGWLAAILACLQHDAGDREAAEATRDVAFRFGQEADHPEIMAWSFELLAWFALVDGRLRDLVNHARTGLAISSGSSASVQLAVQEAKAWARLQAPQEADMALRHAASVLARLPVPEHPEHHFVFDAPKLSFYAASVYSWLGMPAQTSEHAREVIGANTAAEQEAEATWPMRYAETSVSLGLVAVQQGDLEQAGELGKRALVVPRKSASALNRFAELDAALMTRAPDAAASRQYHEQYLETKAALAAAS